jgi:hypothetical protein
MTVNELKERMIADHDDIRLTLKGLEKRKMVTRLLGQRWRLTKPVESDDEEDDDIAAAQKYLDGLTTTKDGSFEIDRKTIQKGVQGALYKMDVKQRQWAACMRTSNPTLASRIMDLLASKPHTFNELFNVVIKEVKTVEDVTGTLDNLEALGQVTFKLDVGQWTLVDKSAKVDKIRQDLHRLVDEL